MLDPYYSPFLLLFSRFGEMIGHHACNLLTMCTQRSCSLSEWSVETP